MCKPLRLLMVEDSVADEELLLRELRRGGYEPAHVRVQTAAELHSALEQKWDLVISDYSMPAFNAPAALAIVKERQVDVPFFVVSGSIGEDRAVDVLKAGAHDFVTKENISRLLPAIERELRDARDREARRAAECALRQAEEQLRQAQKLEAIGQLAGGIAHDFNNLLTGIIGYAELGEETDRSEPTSGYFKNIRQAARRGAALVQHLLAFARKQVVHPQTVDLHKLIQKSQFMLYRLIGEHVEIEVATTGELWRVHVDPNLMDQVLINLCINARDAMPRGGRIGLSTCNVTVDSGFASQRMGLQPGEYVLLTVSDQGEGMEEEVRARIFEPFFTTKVVGKGSGLGLAMVHGTVYQSGGYIEVESELGRGTTFKIYLPRATEWTEEAAAEAVIQDVEVGQATILIAEDEPVVLDFMRIVLARKGYRLLLARDGLEALSKSDGHLGGIDLLIADVIMPRLSSSELARKVAEKHPGVRALFISGYPEGEAIERGWLASGSNFLQKPFSPGNLESKVRESLTPPRSASKRTS